ncbi:MAG: homoserine dehydrogenase [Euryarchaeota archaeon]|nr:homoserine dehydrogenase [Euryarchaeota archaeon]
MKVNVELRLKDVPGQLILALEPISTNGGNIVGVVHHRDVVVGGHITVNVTFEIRSDKTLERILDTWKEREIDVARFGSLYETFPIECLLVGEISPQELNSIVDKIESMEDLESVELRYSVSAASDGKAALVIGKVRRREAVEKVEQFLERRGKRAGFLLIRGLGE